MSNSEDVSTLLTNNFNLSLNQCPKENAKVEYMSKAPYASGVGCLMYISKVPLAQAVSQVCKFMSKPGKRHWENMDFKGLVHNGHVDKVHTSENAANMLIKLAIDDKFKHCLDLLHVSQC
ncbi:hypothetical protein KIW84_014823 [Lathyrus oleraceus]|uniref:Uncharacterized protein n=1 Tax=Pisum sativum TaxID=3888 RepID=A0A9D5BP32_PEA|nr:hypothetical protein KIW84_014823 [Pisum sativum]